MTDSILEYLLKGVPILIIPQEHYMKMEDEDSELLKAMQERMAHMDETLTAMSKIPHYAPYVA